MVSNWENEIDGDSSSQTRIIEMYIAIIYNLSLLIFASTALFIVLQGGGGPILLCSL